MMNQNSEETLNKGTEGTKVKKGLSAKRKKKWSEDLSYFIINL